jgi:hypothetical protein
MLINKHEKTPMKTKHFTWKLIMLLCLAGMASVPSCDWFREDPLYVGTWQYTDKIYAGEMVFNGITTLTLTESTFEEIYVLKADNSSEIGSLLAMKGDLDVSGNEMTFRLTAVGECIRDNQQNCTASVEWFQKGSSTYSTYMQYLKETVQGEFVADEDYLWLVRDRNLDGDTEDTGEDVEFERL